MELDFDIIVTGSQGEVDVIPKATRSRSSHSDDYGLANSDHNAQQDGIEFPRICLPFGVPPIWKSLDDELLEHLENVENLPVYDLNRLQKYIPRKPNIDRLLKVCLTPPQTDISVVRDPRTGALSGFTEIQLQEAGSCADKSMALTRKPDPSSSIKGSSSNLPFWPAGLDPVLPDMLANQESIQEYKTKAPGLSRGLSLVTKSPVNLSQDVKISDLFSAEDLFALDSESDDEPEEALRSGNTSAPPLVAMVPVTDPDPMGTAVDELTKDLPVLAISSVTTKENQGMNTEFAVRINVNNKVDDFEQRVPDMAYKWPFELDIFQKQAIIHLENHDNVFVAAHTSAGKTVIAEYAIALSRKHLTRAIYTSPIKALSNQKFRDFKLTFGDVGLITGDIQLNPEASCLIMTTEILRSMLYGGSEVIRDVEWVIFDEVHYINDAERGVVWEEVLIMLPEHVNIILLSATVPNHMEFADWVGRTRKRKVYVISTPKRPVPLEHFLYVGSSTKGSEELFLLVDSDGKLLETGYKRALAAKNERSSSKTVGPKVQRGGGPGNDKNTWISVIDMLRKKDKLPVVAFTFSKNKIEENSSYLSSVDLTTAAEKSRIHMFIQRSIDKLKGTDKELPQVLNMQDLLKRGIGVHHSGVLPILKEIVELLFQQGLIRVLFATETFAMGVNMPARTVVFDSIRKHDGISFRDLKSGEYIQMAGRAGRRGLDSTGTVIVLCKGDVPELSDLQRMMLGKLTVLESRFRLTYTMMLNLLRVEKLRIQDMLKRSFFEFASQRDEGKHKLELECLAAKVQQLKPIECFFCSQDIEEYYSTCKEYQQLRAHLLATVTTHPQCVKYLNAGRVVLLRGADSLALAVTLATTTKVPRLFKCLVLTDETEAAWKDRLSSANIKVFPHRDPPLGKSAGGGHIVIELEASAFHKMTVTSLSVPSPDKIIDNCSKRQIPRFRDEPPSQATVSVLQELSHLDPSALTELDPIKEFKIQTLDILEQYDKLNLLQARAESYECNKCACFLEHYAQASTSLAVKEEFMAMKYKVSEDSLAMLPEYRQRLEILRSLGYINKTNTVRLKGKVACEIKQQELFITELIFENQLADLHFTEIAALLSCVVFEQKNCSEPNLPPNLKQGMTSMLGIARQLGELQKAHIPDFVVDDYVAEFRFGLAEVVFEWARGLPFVEIAKLTDVQEGIIVRCIQRLDELLRDIKDAAKIIGDPILCSKMEEASRAIKRDIVFAASLYTQ